MKEFPSVDELSFLIGAELMQIVLDPYQVSFLFVDQRYSTRLLCESGFEHLRSNGSMMSYSFREGGCRDFGPITFHHLLFDRVVAVDVSPERFRLTVTFQRAQELRVLSIPGPYESGHIDRSSQGHSDLWIF